MQKRLIALAGIAAATLTCVPAQAAVTLNGDCSSDLSLPSGSSLTSCIGRYDGNVLNNSDNSTINSALSALGYVGSVVYSALPAGSLFTGGSPYTFSSPLSGVVFLGVHYSNANGGPGNSTTFYRIAADNLSEVNLTLPGGANAVQLAAISNVAAVPEPGTWALMLLGLGTVGFALRSRRTIRTTFSRA